jgi:hypothetical protein
MLTGDNGHMAFLLRVELPDVPGSLGALATALGGAGADIAAIEIVERRAGGLVIDDVLLELPPQVMPDALITACHQLEGVTVEWISRYNAGANLSMDLEAVERFTDDPAQAIARLVEVIPETFRTDWALALDRVDGATHVMAQSPTAPRLVAEADDWLGPRCCARCPSGTRRCWPRRRPATAGATGWSSWWDDTAGRSSSTPRSPGWGTWPRWRRPSRRSDACSRLVVGGGGQSSTACVSGTCA